MLFKKLKKNGRTPLFSIQNNGSPGNDKSRIDEVGLQVQRFNYENDLKTGSHEKLLRQLEKDVALKAKDVRRLDIEIVKSDISNICQKARHSILRDLNPVKLWVKNGKDRFEGKFNDFNKEEMTDRLQKNHFQENSAAFLQSLSNDLTKKLEKLKAKRHNILKKLKQYNYELEDNIHEKYHGQTPTKQWYNS